MKRSNIAMLIVFFLLIPLTLFLGKLIPGCTYYVVGTVIMLEVMVPFFMAFEGRKPQARELVVVAVLCALAIAGRVAIPLPHFKAVFGVIMLAGIAFGPETGFMVGAITALVSNFFYSQGMYTPWQMVAYGVGGMLAGFCFRRKGLPAKPWVMGVFGFATVVLLIGPLLDCSGIFLGFSKLNWKTFTGLLAAGLPINAAQGVCTVLVLVLLGKPLLEKLDRVKTKYGMLRGADM